MRVGKRMDHWKIHGRRLESAHVATAARLAKDDPTSTEALLLVGYQLATGDAAFMPVAPRRGPHGC